MKKLKKLIIACDGESASGKSTAAKLISRKYRLLLINSGLLYRYASKLIINHKPKNEISFIKKKFSKLSYKNISKQNLHSEKISDHVYFKCKLDVASYRRWLDIKKTVSFKQVKNSLRKRTKTDKNRKHSPLIRVKDSILIQTDKLNKNQVLKKMSFYIDNLN